MKVQSQSGVTTSAARPAGDDDTSANASLVGAEDHEPDDGESTPAWDGQLRIAPAAGQLAEALRIILFHLDRSQQRQRARRAADDERYRLQVESILCSATKAYLRGELSFRVSLDNNKLKRTSRYKSPLHTPTLPTIIERLCAEGFLMQTAKSQRPREFHFGTAKAKAVGQQSEYAVAARLAPLVYGVSLVDIHRLPGDEIILLRSKRDDFGMAELVEYKRTPAHISAARAELVELNEFRAKANIECLGSPARFDASDRHTRRRWTRASWQCGGRHWGGFWQSMKKAERLNLIRIDDEPVVGVDYVGTIVTLAYASVGHQLPQGDPYGYTLVDRNGANVPTTRKQRKTIFIAAMNGAKEWPRDLRSDFRHRISWKRSVECLAQAHPLIAVYLAADRGQELAYTEATIMAAVLKALRLKAIVALDMFDCVLVKKSVAELATEVMLTEFQRIAGQRARVNVETPDEHPMRSVSTSSLLAQATSF